MCGICGCSNHHHDYPDQPPPRLLRIEQDLLVRNNACALANRRCLAQRGVLALNLVSSPGAGKATLLVETIRRLDGGPPLAVIEGDQQTALDAQRIRATGTPAVQINTGKGCHLDAHRVSHVLEHLAPARGGVLFIENVGNLVCPAGFDLGEAYRVVILSVTEGEDKPLKYPDIFAAADLLPHLDFDLERCIGYARRVRPEIEILALSARSGAGMADWLGWIRQRVLARTPSCIAAKAP